MEVCVSLLATVPLPHALGAYRAVNHQAQVQQGHNILITGIGGTVDAVQFSLLVVINMCRRRCHCGSTVGSFSWCQCIRHKVIAVIFDQLMFYSLTCYSGSEDKINKAVAMGAKA